MIEIITSLSSAERAKLFQFDFFRYPNLSPKAPGIIKQFFPNVAGCSFEGLPESMYDVTLVFEGDHPELPENDKGKEKIKEDEVQAFEIKTNRSLLAASSEFFKSLFYNQMKESFDSSIKINEISPEVFRSCLDLRQSNNFSVKSEIFLS